jgi:hypothetical protein
MRCIGIAFWQGWSAIWVFLLLLLPFALVPGMKNASGAALAIILFFGILASLVYGVIAYLRNSLALPAAVVEDLGVRASMRRSKALATGRTGRIFLLILLVYALWMIAGVIQVPLALLLVRSHAAQYFALQATMLAVSFIATSLVGPVAAIGLCLFYFDERVRREGFDIDVLLRGASVSSPFTPPPIVPVTLADPPDAPLPTPEPI